MIFVRLEKRKAMAIDINKQLLTIQKEWLEICGADDLAKIHPISRPFSFSVTEEYLSSNRKVMFIGQEAKDFGIYSDNWPIEDIQLFNKNYVDIQLGHKSYDEEIKYNGSPFWNLFRTFHHNGSEPVWNNVDKFHRVIDNKTECLSIELERIFNAPYGEDNKSLLMREIEITQPNVIIFITGPYYYESMALSMGVDCKELLIHKPRKNSPCSDISDVINLGMPVLWSYHPAYLSRINSMDTVYEMYRRVMQETI